MSIQDGNAVKAPVAIAAAPVKKRSIVLAGHKTSISLEEPFWQAIIDGAEAREISIADLITQIDTARGENNLSSACRLFAFNELKARVQ